MQLQDAPKGWTPTTAGNHVNWVNELPDDLIEAFARGSEGELIASAEQLEKWRSAFEPILAELLEGRGFVLLNRVPIETLSVDQIRRVYWRIGESLGIPIEQNIQGAMLYDVKDTGADVSEGARFSITNAESGFHTDASFMPAPPDLVGLLCLRTAKEGGESQLVSAYTLHNEISRQDPSALSTLYDVFRIDRRGQVREGEPEVMTAPIFATQDDGLMTRYLDYYIEVGHESVGEPLTDEQRVALGAVRDALRRPEMRVKFSLAPGQILFTNNRWILHNRTAFEDHAEIEKRRHYIRLWLRNH